MLPGEKRSCKLSAIPIVYGSIARRIPGRGPQDWLSGKFVQRRMGRTWRSTSFARHYRWPSRSRILIQIVPELGFMRWECRIRGIITRVWPRCSQVVTCAPSNSQKSIDALDRTTSPDPLGLNARGALHKCYKCDTGQQDTNHHLLGIRRGLEDTLSQLANRRWLLYQTGLAAKA